MHETYLDFIFWSLKDVQVGMPIYTSQIAERLGKSHHLNRKKAAAATAVAIKRIMDATMLPELRCYQKGIYYRTSQTPFGEVGINKEQLIADKYLLPNNGYETGLSTMHRMGLTSQMPRQRILVTNSAKNCTRTDKKLGVVIRPPKTAITAENKSYLQLLDVLDMMDKAPVDTEQPYQIIAEYVHQENLDYETLLAYANNFYNKSTILRIANTASYGGMA